ncbi:hypothetical protein P4K91_27450 [Bacillus anthracis]|uniref:hypothetical protein n=1 Tax=Bacillus anthracis TaxID=1392 RepID=UPI002DBC3225|nr:hypothetical protein [Bacillus anthracis]MEB9909039.1 hypothetical protein [Bacillus anthracis]MEC1955642.1 hypothetical protein [Bacillus anthracis]
MFNEQKLQIWSKIFAIIIVITAIINKFVITLQNKLVALIFLEFTVFCFLFFLYLHKSKNKSIFVVIMYISLLIYAII